MVVKIASAFLEDASAPAGSSSWTSRRPRFRARRRRGCFASSPSSSARGCAIIYVSHRIDEVLRISDRITVLRDGERRLRSPTGGATRAIVDRTHDRPDEPRDGRDRAGSLAADSSRWPSGNDRRTGSRTSRSKLREGEILGVAGLGEAGGDRLLKRSDGRGAARRHFDRGPPHPHSRSSRRLAAAASPTCRASAAPKGFCCLQDIARNVALPHLAPARARFGLGQSTGRARRGGRRWPACAPAGGGPRQSVWRLSGGNQQKVMFARAVAGRAARAAARRADPWRRHRRQIRYPCALARNRRRRRGDRRRLVRSRGAARALQRIVILSDGRISRAVSAEGLTTADLLALCYGGSTE